MSDGEGDAIQPVQIEHSIDEIWAGEQLEQYYNFLDYHFEREGAYCRARSYADSFREVVLFGPFVGRTSIQRLDRPDFEADVRRYLERRFLKVTRV